MQTQRCLSKFLSGAVCCAAHVEETNIAVCSHPNPPWSYVSGITGTLLIGITGTLSLSLTSLSWSYEHEPRKEVRGAQGSTPLACKSARTST
eukprot:scaffold314886_cov18-Tisochrysis_lutea.AAC.1